MPSANQSFQPMQGYQPANQVRELPRANDQAEPLYPKITPQQAMQYARIQDDARTYRDQQAQGNLPADQDIVGPGVYGQTQEQAAYQPIGPTQEQAAYDPNFSYNEDGSIAGEGGLAPAPSYQQPPYPV
jgi:hypothetical protein